MATRYKWEQFNVATTTQYSVASVGWGTSSGQTVRSSPWKVYYASNATIDNTALTIKLTGTITHAGDLTSTTGSYVTIPAKCYFIIVPEGTDYTAAVPANNVRYLTGRNSNSSSVTFDVASSKVYPSARITYYTASGTSVKIKGNTSYGYVTSFDSSAYPSNNYSGSYWYVYVGVEYVNFAGANGVVQAVKSVVCVGGTIKTNVSTYQGVSGAVKQS